LVYPGRKLSRAKDQKLKPEQTFIKLCPPERLQFIAGRKPSRPAFVASVPCFLVAAPRTKRNRRLHFTAFKDLCFSYLLQETAIMGTLSTSTWLENSVLDQIYAWEAYLLCPTEEANSIKLNPDKELRLNSNGKFLDHWMDLNA